MENKDATKRPVRRLIGGALVIVVALGMGLFFRSFQARAAQNNLPDVEFLGEGGFFEIPEGYFFVVELHKEWQCLPGPTFEGQNRVWKSDGCGFERHFQEVVSFGEVAAGCEVEYVIIDDDIDNRINQWQVGGQTVETVTQGMVSEGSFAVPFDGELTLIANDSIGLVSDISCPNLAPIAVDDSYLTNEDTVLSVLAPGVLSNDSDPNNDPLEVSDVDGVSALGALVTVAADGSFTYDPTTAPALQALQAGDAVVDTFDYTASDGNDGAASATVSVTVLGINDPPVALNDSAATDEDTILIVNAPGVLTNDSDIENDPLTVSTFDATSAFGATVSVAANGSFTYDPTTAALLQALQAGDSVVDTFDYSISDGHGGAASATVSVTVLGINDPPVALNDEAITDEDTVLSVIAPGVLANDSDIENDPLNISSFDAVSNLGAAVTVAADGSFTYDPTGAPTLQALQAGDSTVDTFNYSISDGQGGAASAIVSVTVLGINDAPIAVDDLASTILNQTVVINVTANDIDVDGNLDPGTVIIISGPSSGTAVELGGGEISYTPVSFFSGVDSLDYSVCDTEGICDTATVTITVVSRTIYLPIVNRNPPDSCFNPNCRPFSKGE